MNKSVTENNRKLMDQLRGRESFGRFLGFLATTFEMQVEFFETDFLPTLLGLGAWDDRNWSSRIALERHLAELETAAVLQDARPYNGRPRSMRVEMIPVYLPGQPILHSKIFLAVYEFAVQLTIGSANLTEPGYRKNLEVIASFAVTKSESRNSQLVRGALEVLGQQLEDWLTPGSRQLMSRAMNFLESEASGPKVENRWIVVSGSDQPLWRDFQSRWPSSEKIRRIHIVSPFWSEESGNDGPLFSLLNILKSDSLLTDHAEVELYAPARPTGQNGFRPALPNSVCDLDLESLGVKARAHAVDPVVPSAELEIDGDITFNRSLHAKIVVFESDESQLAYLGSANFTRHGWGFLPESTRGNFEAGFVVLTSRDNTDIRSLLPKTTGEPVEISSLAKSKLAEPETEPESNPWPAFIAKVELTPGSQDAGRLEIVVQTVPKLILGEWQLGIEGSEEHATIQFHQQDGMEHRAKLDDSLLSALLKKQEVFVRWWGNPGGTGFPINVSIDARHTLPMSPESGNPLEKHLIAYYQGRIRWEDLFPDPNPEPDEFGIDGIPLEELERGGVDTSGIQSYIVREFVEALKGINDDLKSAAQSTKGCMRLALLGNVSPLALAKRIVEAAKIGERTPTATGFQLVEIINCLHRAKSYETSVSFAEDWRQLIDESIKEVEELLARLKKSFSDGFSDDFEKFEVKIRGQHKGTATIQ